MSQKFLDFDAVLLSTQGEYLTPCLQTMEEHQLVDDSVIRDLGDAAMKSPLWQQEGSREED